jgi:hypothetical protein
LDKENKSQKHTDRMKMQHSEKYIGKKTLIREGTHINLFTGTIIEGYTSFPPIRRYVKACFENFA